MCQLSVCSSVFIYARQFGTDVHQRVSAGISLDTSNSEKNIAGEQEALSWLLMLALSYFFLQHQVT